MKADPRALAIADTVMYEGYMLYPYRATALKNRRPSPFGFLESGDRISCEVLVRGSSETVLELLARALVPATGGDLAAEERHVSVGPVRVGDLRDGATEAALAAGSAHLRVTEEQPGVYRCAVAVAGGTGDPLMSAHALLTVRNGDIVPPRDPPSQLAHLAASCSFSGLYPTLIGEPGTRQLVLCAPIVLEDHPRIAPESAVGMFDATEIDEMLALRIATLDDAERREIAGGDRRVRELVERTDRELRETLPRLHGRLTASAVRPGDRVRLRPCPGADAMDLLLDGRAATVVAVERDLEDRIHVAVTIDDDPGRDLGAAGKIGHRFFFSLDEIERLP